MQMQIMKKQVTSSDSCKSSLIARCAPYLSPGVKSMSFAHLGSGNGNNTIASFYNLPFSSRSIDIDLTIHVNKCIAYNRVNIPQLIQPFTVTLVCVHLSCFYSLLLQTMLY